MANCQHSSSSSSSSSSSGGSSSTVTVNLPVDFEGGSPAFNNFEGGTSSVVDNPYKDGNASDKVAQMVKNGGQVYGGSSFSLGATIDFDIGSTFTMKVWSKNAAPVLLKIEAANGQSDNIEVTANHTGGSAWQTLSFDMSAASAAVKADAGTITIIFVNGTLGAGGEDWTFYYDDLTQVDASSASVVVNLPVNFEGGSPAFINFDGGTSSVVDNPNNNSDNNSAKVAQMVKNGGQVYGGSSFSLGATIDFDIGSTFTMKVWSKNAAPVLLKIEAANGQSDNIEVTANHTGGSAWQTLSFDMSAASAAVKADAGTITIIFVNGTLGAGGEDWTFYYDDLTQLLATPSDVATVPTTEAASVLSIYSDTFTGANVVTELNLNPGWGQATTWATQGVDGVSGNEFIKLSGFNYQGITFAKTDVTCHTHLHVDYWTPNLAAFGVSVIGNDGPVETKSDVTVGTKATWQSLDIGLADFGAAVTSSATGAFQIKFDGGTGGNDTLYLDNIYFYGGATTCP